MSELFDITVLGHLKTHLLKLQRPELCMLHLGALTLIWHRPGRLLLTSAELPAPCQDLVTRHSGFGPHVLGMTVSGCEAY